MADQKSPAIESNKKSTFTRKKRRYKRKILPDEAFNVNWDIINAIIDEYVNSMAYFIDAFRRFSRIFGKSRMRSSFVHVLAALYAIYVSEAGYFTTSLLLKLTSKIYDKIGQEFNEYSVRNILNKLLKDGLILRVKGKKNVGYVYKLSDTLINILQNIRDTAVSISSAERNFEKHLSKEIVEKLTSDDVDVPLEEESIIKKSSGVIIGISAPKSLNTIRMLKKDSLFAYRKTLQVYLNTVYLNNNPSEVKDEINLKKLKEALFGKNVAEVTQVAQQFRIIYRIDPDDLMFFPKGYSGDPAKAFVVEGIVTANRGLSSLWLFDGVICEKGHLFFVDAGQGKQQEYCIYPGCNASVAGTFKYRLPGVSVVFESFENVGNRPTYNLFIPLPLWEEISKSPGAKKILLIAELPREIFVPKQTVKTRFIALGYFPLTKEYEFTEDETRVIEKLVNYPTWRILKRISDTVFGHLIGIPHGKIAALLTAFSQGTDPIKFKNLEKFGPLYTLFIGPPQTGKSELLKLTVSFANLLFKEDAFYYAGATSRAGITFAYDRETGSVRYGIEILNDGRIVAYDELDKVMNKEDLISQLNDLMSSYVARYSKAHIGPVSHPTRAAKLFAANVDIEGTINDIQDLVDVILQKSAGRQQIFGRATEPFVSRIDLLVYFPRPFSARDVVFLNAELLDPLDENIPEKYVQYIHERVLFDSSPTVFTEEAIEELKKVILTLTSKYGGNPFVRYMDSPRRLYTIQKLARTIAHMHLRKEILPQDVREAFAFFFFIHIYPFLNIVSKDMAMHYFEVIEEFREELGEYYVMSSELLTGSSFSIGGAEYETKPKSTIIKSEREFISYVISKAEKLGEFTLSEIISAIRDDIFKGIIKLKPGTKPYKMLFDEEISITYYMENILKNLAKLGYLYTPDLKAFRFIKSHDEVE